MHRVEQRQQMILTSVYRKEIAEEKRKSKSVNLAPEIISECELCAQEHEQLVEWLEELQRYRAIGTPEECRAAVEKQTAKKIVRRKATDEDVENGLRDFITIKGMIFRCPTCGCCIAVDGMESCWECGQILDWSDEE